MDVMAAIKGRRTVHDFSREPVTHQEMEQILEAAIWAPNHKLTNPWEFYVVSGAAKEALARLRGELKRSKHPDPQSDQAQASYDKAYRELAEVPYAVLVCQRLADDPARRHEDLLAVACAIQNMMLAAYSMGIGTFWASGAVISHPETLKLLGVTEGLRPIGLIYVGRPGREHKAPARSPLHEHVKWIAGGSDGDYQSAMWHRRAE